MNNGMPHFRNFQPPDGGYGWVIVISSVLITSCITPIVQCFGLIYEQPFKEMGITATQISFLLHLYNSIMCTLCFVAGPLLKTYNFKQIVLAGCLFVCVGVSTTIFSKNYTHLLITFCILIGIGQGLITQGVSLAINTYFKRRLTLAMSYSVTGTGLLPIVMPQITNLSLNNYGIQGTVLILAGLSFHSFIGALLLRPVRNKKQITLKHNNNADRNCSGENSTSSQNQNEEARSLLQNGDKLNKLRNLLKLLNLELLKESSFVILIIGMAISYVAELNFNLINPFVLAELGQLNRADVALAMSIHAVGDISGRLFVPIISHKLKWKAKPMYVLSLIGSCLGRQVMISFCDVRNAILSISVLLGVSKGSRAVYQSLVLPEYINLERLPVAMGFLMILNGVLSLGIGPLIGLIHDLTKSYKYALQTASLLSISCATLWFLESVANTIRPKTVTHQEALGRSP